jgi:hypothetical protein
MNPLDLLKVKFQVSMLGPKGGIGHGIWLALRDIRASKGWPGLYRGLSPNIASNASSLGLYFLLYISLFACHALRLSLSLRPFLLPSTSSTLPKRVHILLASLDDTHF